MGKSFNKIKTADLTGPALDWAVSMIIENSRIFPLWFDGKPQSYSAYSTDWSKGGPIIEREYIDVEYFPGDVVWQAQAFLQDEYCTQYGPTPLVAAMRCYVASRLGDEVDVPEELK